MRWHEIDWHRFEIYTSTEVGYQPPWIWMVKTDFPPKIRTVESWIRAKGRNCRYGFEWLHFHPIQAHSFRNASSKCQELELRHAELGLKEWCRDFMDKLPKGATNWEWINNMGLGLGVNIWLIETMEIWKLRTSRSDFQQVLDCL